MKILVLTQGYPTNNSRMLMYVHTRNVFYVQQGIDVTVINFSCQSEYELDGVRVIPCSYYSPDQHFDLLICHAPNLKSHLRFLNKYICYFPKVVFFIHGHEMLRVKHVYPEDFPYMPKHGFKVFARDLYDIFKCRVWNWYIKKHIQKIHIVFVSGWMRDEFIKWTKLLETDIKGHYSIIYNSVGELFEKERYDESIEKEYDFITIRAKFDLSKYCVDVVNDLAKANPQYKFLLVGTGNYFDHYSKAENLTWMNTTLSHTQIIEYLNKAKIALMPTRTDAQGVMMCEMAAFGMPIITSDIPVCSEVFGKNHNVYLIQNTPQDLTTIMNTRSNMVIEKDYQYTAEYTVGNEIRLFKDICL